MSRLRPGRSLLCVIFAAMALAGCGGGDPGSGGDPGGSGTREEGPLDEALAAAITHFWEGTGVPADVPIRFGYKYRTRDDSKSCEHLAETDRWYAERTSVLNQGERDQQAMVDGTVAYLEREGFTISRWKTSAPDAPVAYGFIGHRETTAVSVDIGHQGRTDLTVRMGPCATPTLDGFSQPLFTRIS
jgi:hypothetical protein